MKIFCSGIGGIGVSSYASLQNAAGHTVLGSDQNESSLVDDLRQQGIHVSVCQDGSTVPDDADLFVYSEAIPEDAPERIRATELGIVQQSYFTALGELSKKSYVIAVCGTHGKSSTTAMAARVLVELGIDATIQVGTKLQELQGKNWQKGEGNIFLLEACEYRKSFHALQPDMILMTNVDGDHFDSYKSVEDYQSAFVDFVQKLPKDGVLITHMQDTDCATVASTVQQKVRNADLQPLPALQTPGVHMQQNAQLVLCMAEELGLDFAAVQKALAGYAGCWRRLEHKGTFGEDIMVIDDYAHHPIEVHATLQALKERYPSRQLLCVFQPHTHQRTQQFYTDFTKAFHVADEVVLTNIYEARPDIEGEKVDIATFATDIANASSVPCAAVGTLHQAEEYVQNKAQAGSLVLCMGAGTITQLAEHLVL